MALAARASVVGLGVLMLLPGCASRAGTSTETPARHLHAARPGSRLASTAACKNEGGGFELSLAVSSGGARNPIAAAQRFVRHGGVNGFGTVKSVWRVASTPRATRDEATLVDGRVSLHAVRLPDRTWAVDEGSRCG